jgi:hypothetical protein
MKSKKLLRHFNRLRDHVGSFALSTYHALKAVMRGSLHDLLAIRPTVSGSLSRFGARDNNGAAYISTLDNVSE